MTDLKNNLEEVWREDFECTYKTKDNEIGWVYYLQARKKAQEEIEQLKQELQKAREQLEKCEDALKHYTNRMGMGGTARQYFKDKQGEG